MSASKTRTAVVTQQGDVYTWEAAKPHSSALQQGQGGRAALQHQQQRQQSDGSSLPSSVPKGGWQGEVSESWGYTLQGSSPPNVTSGES